MGSTIHYNGKIERARLTEMLDAARLYCAEQRWAALEVEERIVGHIERIVETRETSIEIQGIEGTAVESITQLFPIDDTLRGLLITIHPESEPVWLTFNEAGEMVYYMALNDAGEYWENKSLFTKTQSAGVDAHIALCEFLHWLNDTYMPDLHVYDEGNYYESGDAQKLSRAFDTLNAALDQMQTALENMDSDNPRAARMRAMMGSQLPESGEQTDATDDNPGSRKVERNNKNRAAQSKVETRARHQRQ